MFEAVFAIISSEIAVSRTRDGGMLPKDAALGQFSTS